MGLSAGRAGAFLLLSLLALQRAAAQEPVPPGTGLVAPPRVTLHPDPRVGDTVERTVQQRQHVMRERTTVVGRDPRGYVIERTGASYGGYALRLVVDPSGRTLAAEAGFPGARERVPITIAEEASPEPEALEGQETIEVPAGRFRCERWVLERDEPFPTRNVRWVAAEGPLAGELIREETRAGGVLATLDLLRWEEASEEVAGRPLPCLHLVRGPAIDGVAQAPIEEWVSRAPLLFGERLVRLENGLGSTRLTDLGAGGTTVFPAEPSR